MIKYVLIFRLKAAREAEQQEITDSDDVTSMGSEIRSDIVRACDASGYSELPMICADNNSTFQLSHEVPVRERGHSLSVERSPGLLEHAPEPRSKSLRLKRKDTSK